MSLLGHKVVKYVQYLFDQQLRHISLEKLRHANLLDVLLLYLFYSVYCYKMSLFLQVSNHLPTLRNDSSDECNPETQSLSLALEGNQNSSQCLDMLPDVSQTESVDIFMEASESVHEEPSTVHTKFASTLYIWYYFSIIYKVNI